MRIVLAVRNRSTVGGAETYQANVTLELRRRGHDVGWLYENEGLTDSRIADCEMFSIADPAGWDTLVAWKPDVAFVQDLRSAPLERRIAERFPSVLFAHQYHGTCISGTKRHFAPGNSACRRNLSPACLALYLPRRCGGSNPFTMFGLYREQMSRRNTLESFAAVVVGSNHMRREYQRLNLKRATVVLAPLGIEAIATAQPRTLSSKPTVAFMGRLTRIKGGRVLLSAIARANRSTPVPTSLIVIGDGPERAALGKMADSLGLSCVFTGWLEQEQAGMKLRKADLLAMPSLWAEPFGLVGIEAAAAGIPAVGFDVGGIGDWLREGESGHLVSGSAPGASALAGAIIKCLGSADHYRHLSQGALKVAGQFTIEKHVDKLESVFGHAVASR